MLQEAPVPEIMDTPSYMAMISKHASGSTSPGNYGYTLVYGYDIETCFRKRRNNAVCSSRWNTILTSLSGLLELSVVDGAGSRGSDKAT
jgi:hypothetical protein